MNEYRWKPKYGEIWFWAIAETRNGKAYPLMGYGVYSKRSQVSERIKTKTDVYPMKISIKWNVNDLPKTRRQHD